MHKRMFVFLAPILLLTATAARISLAQETPKPAAEAKNAAQTSPLAVYRLEFVVRELEGDKRINSRSYTMSARDDNWGKIRVNSRVPFHAEGDGMQYQGVGISIDCRPEARESGIFLNTTFDSSSVFTPDPSGSSLLRNVNYSGGALVAIGKPTVIAKLDDVVTTHRYEVEVTATKVQ